MKAIKVVLGFSIWAMYSLCIASSSISNNYWNSAGHEIDRLIELKLKATGSQFAAEVSENLYLRRLYLSLIGRIPSVKEVEAFRGLPTATRWDELMDSLIDSPGYDSHMFNFWADLLRLKENLPGLSQAGIPYIAWIKEQIRNNTPYNKMVYDMIVSQGDTWNENHGATGFYRRDAGMPLDHFALTMQTFSGIQLQCAQCHNHPFEKWTQKEFYEMAAFLHMRQNVVSENAFSMKDLKQHYREEFKDRTSPTRQTLRNSYNALNDVLGRSIPNEGRGELRLPKDYQYSNGKPKELIAARTIMGEEIHFDNQATNKNSRVVFAEWLTSPEHKYFTRVIVNRLWKQVMGVGLYEPVDDIRENTVINNEALMAYLEDQLKFLDYDLKKFIRLLHSSTVLSREAQLYAKDSSTPYGFTGPVMRRLTAEQLWDSAMTLRQSDLDSIKAPTRKAFYASYSLLTQMEHEEIVYFIDGLVARQGEQGQSRGAVHRKIKEMSLGAAFDPMAESSSSMMMSMTPQDELSLLYGDPPEPVVELRKHPKISNEIRKIYGKYKSYSKNKNPEKIEETKRVALATVKGIGLSDKDLKTCFKYFRTLDKKNAEKLKYARASELGSPAPKGHFLRIFGASDRDFIDNDSLDASTPQALEMMNGFINYGVLQQKNSVITQGIKELNIEETIEYLYLAMLTRQPTSEEKKYLQEFVATPSWSNKRDIAWAIVNGPEFSFFY